MTNLLEEILFFTFLFAPVMAALSIIIGIIVIDIRYKKSERKNKRSKG